MIRLCEACWLLITGGELDEWRPDESRVRYAAGQECAFLHVPGADAALKEYGKQRTR